jgi:uncharacterized protein with HEPN domain
LTQLTQKTQQTHAILIPLLFCVYSSFAKDFAVIAEVAKHVPESVSKDTPEIPWKEMAGMRDAFIQSSFGVDLKSARCAVKKNI